MVKPGRETEFETVWKELTKMILKHQKSLGSRLHLANPLEYIAYAQWPSREKWKDSSELPLFSNELKARMIECCFEIKIVQELTVLHDLLK